MTPPFSVVDCRTSLDAGGWRRNDATVLLPGGLRLAVHQGSRDYPHWVAESLSLPDGQPCRVPSFDPATTYLLVPTVTREIAAALNAAFRDL